MKKFKFKSSAKKSKAQVSMEYLIIIGISFAILIPGGYFFYSYSQKSNDGSIRMQITQIGNAIITNTESIYGLAAGSLITTDFKYPKNIRDIYILDGNPSELVIKYELSSGMNEAVFFSKIKMSGNYNYSDPTRKACNNPCTTCPPCIDSSITNSTFTERGTHNLKFESKTSYVLITQVK